MYPQNSYCFSIVKCITLFACLHLIACSGLPPKNDTSKPSLTPTTPAKVNTIGWHTVRFQIAWQPETEPDWYIDTLLAGEVIAPLFKLESGKQFKLWRFHRRAVNDGTGHAFSFIFYSQSAHAEQIYSAINKNTLLAQWQREGRIKQIHFDDLQKNSQPNIEDTSDNSWPSAIQKTWPVFIMGASQMWLDLIAEMQLTLPKDMPIELRYQTIEKQITQLWQNNGQHAWLHHLNALYGYSPIAMHF